MVDKVSELREKHLFVEAQAASEACQFRLKPVDKLRSFDRVGDFVTLCRRHLLKQNLFENLHPHYRCVRAGKVKRHFVEPKA